MMNPEVLYQQAKSHLALKEYNETLRTVQTGLIFNSAYKPFYELALETLLNFEADEEAILFEKALADFESHTPFFDLGYHFVEVNQWPMAEAMLERANALKPEDCDVAYEYSLALAANFRFQKALDVLKKTNYTADFWTSYRVYFFEILLNQDIKTAKEFIRYIRQVIYEKPVQDEDDKFALYKLNQLQEMVQRMESVGNPEQHIRDYHFVQYGGAILHFMDNEEEISVAGGRAAALWLSSASVRNIAENTHSFLNEMELKPRQILHAPERNSLILATILGNLLNIPFQVLDKTNAGKEDSLIIAAKSEDFAEWRALSEIQPRQWTMVWGMNWLEEAVFCPDITGVIAQYIYFPWEETIRIDSGTGNPERVPADNRNAGIIAREISDLLAEETEKAAFEKHLTFYKKQKQLLKCAQNKGKRHLFVRESPLGGSFFG
ncbi:MAG: hypothetical protein K1X92_08710 [Bacteroidia bacterium]|nr:hypothetical protein [Bacteroidia bacterium]